MAVNSEHWTRCDNCGESYSDADFACSNGCQHCTDCDEVFFADDIDEYGRCEGCAKAESVKLRT